MKIDMKRIEFIAEHLESADKLDLMKLLVVTTRDHNSLCDTIESLKEGETLLQEKLDVLNDELKKVKRANSKLKSAVRHKRRLLSKYTKEQPKKQHYKNGRRGSNFNG